jgi:hypothetical protein
MPRGEKDHATNWMIQHHARGLLRLVGIARFRGCRAAHPRITLPQALPDGLLEVTLPEAEGTLQVLLEMETYPSTETDAQLVRDMNLAELALGVLPDTVVIVLCRRGKQKQSKGCLQQSPLGWSSRRHRWRVIELWKVPAEALLALDEVGLIPLLPLTRSKAAPETLLQQCKERIEQQGRPAERATLLTITAIMTATRFGHTEQWLALLGGKNVVTHSPLYQKWMEEERCATTQANIVSFLEGRFGTMPEELAAHIRAVTDLEKLERGVKQAAVCTSLTDFRKRFAKR